MTAGTYIGESFPASAPTFDAMVQYDAAQRHVGLDENEDEGWSEPTWVRLANGDLILGCFPRGDTYMELEREVENDRCRAEALDSLHSLTIDPRDVVLVDENGKVTA